MELLRRLVDIFVAWTRGATGTAASLAGSAGVPYVALGVVAAGVAATGATVVWYTQTHRPLAEAPLVRQLPGIAAATPAAPPFLFSIYGLDQPLGVATSPDGRLIYGADSEGARVVHLFDRSGKELATFAPPNTTPTQRRPARVAVGPDGRVYVSDLLRGEIDVYSADGAYQGVARPPSLEKGRWQPLAMAFDRGGNLYVADATPGHHRVLVMDSQGTLKGRFGQEGKGPGELSFPNGLAVDDQGLVYVSDSSNSRMQILDPGAGFTSIFRSPHGSNMPRGAAIAGGQLFVADTIGAHVSVFALEGTPRFLYAFGSEGRADGQFLHPEGLAVDPDGRVYVADRQNNRIQVFGYR